MHTFGPAAPVLRVGNLAVSIEYYVNRLGFQIDFQGPGVFASVSRGRCVLFLSEGDQGHTGAWVWIGVSDVELLHQEFTAKGALIRQGPTNFSWAREIQVTDPDGNVLRFGSDPLPGRPYGPWLDMHGVSWQL
ncbi:MAG TPA: glyoxalase superfamily protein [Paludibaculum sp.]|jgi:catechol 2,3-dioxygenase-like lactoylglutathione lyase family enzyme